MQEHKTNAINEGAALPLTLLVNESLSTEVRSLSCQALASLAQLLPGRQSIVRVKGLQALTAALQTTPAAAAGALRVSKQLLMLLILLVVALAGAVSSKK